MGYVVTCLIDDLTLLCDFRRRQQDIMRRQRAYPPILSLNGARYGRRESKAAARWGGDVNSLRIWTAM